MLDIKNVDLFYGESQVLRRVNISATQGGVTCLMGRNGVGKTSLLRAICGRHPVKNGDMLWNGKPINTLSADARARMGIACVPQGREIFSQLSVHENLKTGFAALPRKQRHIPEQIFELFPILKDMLHRRGGDLSGGQQQQLAIGRALVMRPQLLILDEPTEGIQPSIIKNIKDVIKMLRDQGSMAILLVEQYFEFARDLADHYAVMDRGEIILAGQGKDMVEDEVRRHITV